MSFQQFGDSFQGQQPEESGAPAAQPQQPPMGQPIESQQGQFPPTPSGAPGSAPGPGSQSGGEPKTTLWMGELEPWIDENFVRSVWFGMGYQVNVKMIRDKFSG
ncbi:hypothetical protein KCU78_g24295, partial [Aureobasidium melanogenum]